MKPILFNTEMVRAILEGKKTGTRRDPFQTSPDYDAWGRLVACGGRVSAGRRLTYAPPK